MEEEATAESAPPKKKTKRKVAEKTKEDETIEFMGRAAKDQNTNYKAGGPGKKKEEEKSSFSGDKACAYSTGEKKEKKKATGGAEDDSEKEEEPGESDEEDLLGDMSEMVAKVHMRIKRMERSQEAFADVVMKRLEKIREKRRQQKHQKLLDSTPLRKRRRKLGKTMTFVNEKKKTQKPSMVE